MKLKLRDTSDVVLSPLVTRVDRRDIIGNRALPALIAMVFFPPATRGGIRPHPWRSWGT